MPPVEDEHAAMLALLADGESWSSSGLALALGASQRTVQRALESLAAAGKVQPFGRGLAWAEGTLSVGQHRGRKIHQVDPQTGVILRTIESNRVVTGVTWIEGELWHGTWEGDQSELRRVDPQTGEVLEQLEMLPGGGVSGLESDGGDQFFCGGGSSGKVRVVHRPRRDSTTDS